MPSDIDELMSREDIINFTEADIDEIIKYHRAARASRAAGIKPKKTFVDLSAVTSRLDLRVPAAPKIERRNLG